MLNFTIVQIIFVFFLCIFINTFIVYLFFKYRHLNHQNSDINKMLTRYSDGIDMIVMSISDIQSNTINNFEAVNDEIKALSMTLSNLKTYLIKVEELEKEIIKYKKIIKRLEKNYDKKTKKIT